MKNAPEPFRTIGSILIVVGLAFGWHWYTKQAESVQVEPVANVTESTRRPLCVNIDPQSFYQVCPPGNNGIDLTKEDLEYIHKVEATYSPDTTTLDTSWLPPTTRNYTSERLDAMERQPLPTGTFAPEPEGHHH